jgi:NACHT domain
VRCYLVGASSIARASASHVLEIWTELGPQEWGDVVSRRMLVIGMSAVLTPLAGVAVNQILNDGKWNWPWSIAAVVLTLLIVVLANRLTAIQAATVSVSTQLEDARRTLAAQVQRQWDQEIRIRQLDDPTPLAVRWRFTELDVADHPVNVLQHASLQTRRESERPQFDGRTDRVKDMVKVFRTLPRRRLVILGDPGMGKTTLAVLLLREFLADLRPDDPVPVLFTMSGWDPDTQPLHQWLTEQLTRTYPALRAARFGPDAAQTLVLSHKVLPILDGLDELAEPIRPRVLAALNASLTHEDALILTCRTEQYVAAVAEPGGDVLTSGAVIEPTALNPDDVASYLRRCVPPRAAGRWSGLLTILTRQSDAPLSRALTTPLAVWLLRKGYIDTGTNPADLTDTVRFSTAETITEHLLDHVVDAFITRLPTGPDDRRHPFQPRRMWKPEHVERWLAFLANHLRTLNSRDFAWWELHQALPESDFRATRVFATGLLPGLVSGVGVGLLAAHDPGLSAGLVAGPLVGLFFGLVFGLRVEAGPRPRLTLSTDTQVDSWVDYARRPAYVDIRIAGRLGALIRDLKLVLATLVVLIPLYTLLFAAAVNVSWLEALAFCALLVPCLLVIELTDWARRPAAESRIQSPPDSLRRDLKMASLNLLAKSSALGLSIGLPIGFLIGPTAGLIAGVALWLVFGPMFVFTTASGGYFIAVLVLRARRKIPARPMRFFEDAHRAGLLRQAGSVYQFRHAELHDYLARRYQTR